LIDNYSFAESSQCHKLSYSRLCGLDNFIDLSDVERELAILRSGIKIENQTSATICFHHKKVFLDRFESQHTTCFDPLQRHKKTAKSTLRTLTIEDSNVFAQKLGRKIVPGWKLCSRC